MTYTTAGPDQETVLADLRGRFLDFYGEHTPLRQNGGEWRGPCPLHGGQRDSFAVDADAGHWYCHSECQAGGDVFDFVERRDGVGFSRALEWIATWAGTAASIVPDRAVRRTGKKAQLGQIVAAYDYVDAQGHLLFQVTRHDPKDFRQRRPDGQGGWITNLTGVTPVLYRLPEVLVAAEAGKTLYVCEGEKDADALIGSKLAATTSPMGAEKWRDDYTDAFCGSRGVVVLPDNDDKGRSHAAQVAEALHRRRIRVKVVSLPGIPEKGDVSDWLAAGGTAEKLSALAKEVPEWTPEAGRAAVSGEEWPDPVPFADAALPPFPTEALPPFLAAMVADVVRCVQVPAEQAGLLALSVLAAASAHSCRVEIMPGYREPLNLYVACIAEPGERKTHTLDPLKAPLEAAERDRAAAAKADIAQAKEQLAIEEKRLAYLRDLAAKSKNTADREAAQSDAKDLAANRTQVPPEPRLLVGGDVTPEGLVMMLAEQKGRLALFEDEGGIFSILAGRYSDGNPNLDAILKAHGGGQIRVDRRSRDPVYVARACLTIGLAVQPDVLASLSDTPAFRGRGLLGRFLYALPQSLAGSRSLEFRPPDQGVRAGYEAHIRRLLDLFPSDPEQEGPLLRLSPAAFAIHKEAHDAVDRRQAEGGDLSGIKDWASKLAGQIARIAGIFHLAEQVGLTYPGAPLPWDVPIGEAAMEAAWAIGDFLIPHALAAYGQLRADPARRLAQRVLSWIERTGKDAFKLRECQNALSGGAGVTADETQAALSELSERGYIAVQDPPPRAGKGRTPRPAYTANPCLLHGREWGG